MPRKIELNDGKLQLVHNKIEGFLERTVNKIGTSAKVDVPKRYIGRKVYVIVTKDKTKEWT